MLALLETFDASKWLLFIIFLTICSIGSSYLGKESHGSGLCRPHTEGHILGLVFMAKMGQSLNTKYFSSLFLFLFFVYNSV